MLLCLFDLLFIGAYCVLLGEVSGRISGGLVWGVLLITCFFVV